MASRREQDERQARAPTHTRARARTKPLVSVSSSSPRLQQTGQPSQPVGRFRHHLCHFADLDLFLPQPLAGLLPLQRVEVEARES
uniref:Uncharacterized protein n=1 Tax=Oryza barthii TaxID=65489 RepID=A0A0D3G8X7_9ORYZ